MSHLTVTERRNAILELLNDTGRVRVNDLSEQFGVTGVVIRNDLGELEKTGCSPVFTAVPLPVINHTLI